MDSTGLPPEAGAGVERLYVAGLGSRVAGYIVDIVVVMLIWWLILVISRPFAEAASSKLKVFLAVLGIWVLMEILYHAVSAATIGYSVGKYLAGTRIIDALGQRPSPIKTLVRAIVGNVFGLLKAFWVGFVDPLAAFINARRRALHDFAAGTYVVRTGEPVSSVRIAAVGLIALVLLPFVARHSLHVSAFRAHYVPSGTMRPTIEVNDKVLACADNQPGRGDIVTFRLAKDVLDPSFLPGAPQSSMTFVKRVVAAGADIVAIRDGRLHVNGQAVVEPYVTEPIEYEWPGLQADYVIQPQGEPIPITDGEVQVPTGHVFLLGDNRNSSYDSHEWIALGADGQPHACPFVPVDDLRGKVFLILAPLERARVLE